MQFRFAALLLFAAALVLAMNALLLHWLRPWTAGLLSLALLLPLSLWSSAIVLVPLTRLLRALQNAVYSYRDGDFSMSITAGAPDSRDELGRLQAAHAELGLALREQRQQLAHRELLLDTVVQNTPLALLLCDAESRIVYANLAARALLGQGRSLVGGSLAELVAAAPPALGAALQSDSDQLFSIAETEDMPAGATSEAEFFHLSQRTLALQGQAHRLILLRRMTRELSRQEVSSWKRVIRVLSHEMNNSLAPISSLAHSGAELARRGDTTRAETVFNSIGARAAHLHGFLSGYASLAKLPAPRRLAQPWQPLVDALTTHYPFSLGAPLPAEDAQIDTMQIEQALINLIKNAHEAGGERAAVTLTIDRQGPDWRLRVADRGPGMSEAVLAQALLPFYSTKRSGTGLGLALAREIAEAHGGRIALNNRAPAEGGGLEVTLWIPV